MRVQLDCSDSPSKTQQHFKDECDVNQIMAHWRKTGEMNHLNEREPSYGDFSNATDYLEARQACIDAEADFMTLSARIRDRFDHDPAKLLAFVYSQDNTAEAIELGLIPKPEEPDPPADPPIPPETPPEPPPEGGGE